MEAKYVRLFSDAEGASHFEELESELLSTAFAPHTPPLFVSTEFQAVSVSFFGAPPAWQSDWHPSSGRHLFAVLSGQWEITASDGESRRFGKGDAVLVEDTTGKGHTSRVISLEESLALLVRLA